MAKVPVTGNIRIVGLKATTIGALQGTFMFLVGLVVAVVRSIGDAVDFAENTDSVLSGLTFGLAQGIIAIIFVPLIYFIIGWIVGFIQGLILNVLLGLAGGVVLKTTPDIE